MTTLLEQLGAVTNQDECDAVMAIVHARGAELRAIKTIPDGYVRYLRMCEFVDRHPRREVQIDDDTDTTEGYHSNVETLFNAGYDKHHIHLRTGYSMSGVEKVLRKIRMERV